MVAKNGLGTSCRGPKSTLKGETCWATTDTTVATLSPRTYAQVHDSGCENVKNPCLANVESVATHADPVVGIIMPCGRAFSIIWLPKQLQTARHVSKKFKQTHGCRSKEQLWLMFLIPPSWDKPMWPKHLSKCWHSAADPLSQEVAVDRCRSISRGESWFCFHAHTCRWPGLEIQVVQVHAGWPCWISSLETNRQYDDFPVKLNLHEACIQ